MPSLILIKAPSGTSNSGKSYTLQADSLVLGRDETCEIVVPNNAVSRRHAQIDKINGKYYLKDLNSRNHTYLNNKEILAPTPLSNSDCIKICDFQYMYQDDSATGVKPLPEHLSKPKVEAEGAGAVEVEMTMSTRSATELLETQPSERIRAILDISIALSRILELDPLLNKIAETLLDVFKQADRCFVIMQDGEVLVPRVVKARRSNQGDDHRFSKTIIRRCIQTLEAYISADASNDANIASQSIVDFRIRSVMCVPLASSDGKTAIGAIQLDAQDRSKRFREDDLKLLTIVSNLCGLALERARMHEDQLQKEKQENEIRMAQKIQLGFLPQTTPKMEGYEFYAHYSAAQTVGGDYYDFIHLSDGRVAVLLGDVAGKGVPASLLMAKLSGEARNCMLTQADLVQAINMLNEQLIIGGIGDRFVTLAAMVFDPKNHKATIINAGHMNPMIYRVSDGKVIEAISNAESGLPLGIMSGFEYCSVEVDVNLGDNFVVFTDGVTDAMAPSGDMFGMEGFEKALTDQTTQGPPNRAAIVGERIINAVKAHANGRAQNDDIALVCVGRLHPSVSTLSGI